MHLGLTILIGVVTGFLVGLTGVGGGALMTPVLVLTGWARPVVAVGTDLIWGMLTKALGAAVHYRQRTIDLRVVKHLAIGSIPGAMLGLLLLAYLRGRNVAGVVDTYIVRVLGLALIIVACTMVMRMMIRLPIRLNPAFLARRDRYTSIAGFFIGFLVGITSVGSGSLIIAILLVLYPGESLTRLIGTDLFHALLLTTVAGLGHVFMGTVDVHLLLSLLAGSVPGVWLGSRFSVRFPERVMRPLVATLLFATGCKLL